MQAARCCTAIGCPWRALGKRKGLSRFPLFHLFDFFLDVLDLDAVFADIEPQVGVNAHVLVSNPDEREKRNQVAAPVVEQQLVMGED